MAKGKAFKALSNKETIGIFKWAIFLLSSVALVAFLAAGGALLIGRKLDAVYGTGYWITLFLGLLGLLIVLAFTLAVALRSARGIRQITDKDKKEEGDLDRDRRSGSSG